MAAIASSLPSRTGGLRKKDDQFYGSLEGDPYLGGFDRFCGVVVIR